MWLEMSNDPMHGGGDWGFKNAVWAPTTKLTKKGRPTTWVFYSLVERVRRDDVVLHLRDEGPGGAFVGY